MTKTLSIIIPAYNVERYIERCIESIVSQNTSPNEYELIVINDGSTDHTLQILERLEDKYQFILINQQNLGASAARNAGIKEATGEYIFFIDADDYIEPDSLSFLSEYVSDKKTDIVLFGTIQHLLNGKQQPLCNNLSDDNIQISIADYLQQHTVRSAVWHGIFKRKLFIENNISLREDLISEDDEFVICIFAAANSICSTHRLVYHYHSRHGSLSKNRSLDVRFLEDKIKVLTESADFLKKIPAEKRVGIQRKLNFISVDIIRLLMRNKIANDNIDYILQKLRTINYFPIREGSYSLKYKLFRLIFKSPSSIKMGRTVSRYF